MRATRVTPLELWFYWWNYTNPFSLPAGNFFNRSEGSISCFFSVISEFQPGLLDLPVGEVQTLCQKVHTLLFPCFIREFYSGKVIPLRIQFTSKSPVLTGKPPPEVGELLDDQTSRGGSMDGRHWFIGQDSFLTVLSVPSVSFCVIFYHIRGKYRVNPESCLILRILPVFTPFPGC